MRVVKRFAVFFGGFLLLGCIVFLPLVWSIAANAEEPAPTAITVQPGQCQPMPGISELLTRPLTKPLVVCAKTPSGAMEISVWLPPGQLSDAYARGMSANRN